MALEKQSSSSRWYLAAGAAILAIALVFALIAMRAPQQGEQTSPSTASPRSEAPLPSPSPVPAATLWFAIPELVYKAGEEYLIEVRLDTRGSQVNAVRAVVQYDPGALEVLGLDGSGSGFPMEAAPKDALTPGRAEIVRFIVNEALVGEGQVTRIRVKPRTPGQVELRLSPEESQYSLFGGAAAQRFADIQDGSFVVQE